MICGPCQRAGACNALINEEPRADITQALQIKAEKLHGKCKHPDTCACQHFIGQAIQEEYR